MKQSVRTSHSKSRNTNTNNKEQQGCASRLQVLPMSSIKTFLVLIVTGSWIGLFFQSQDELQQWINDMELMIQSTVDVVQQLDIRPLAQ